MDLYVISTIFYSNRLAVCTRDQLLPILANDCYQRALEKNKWKKYTKKELAEYNLDEKANHYDCMLEITKFFNAVNPYLKKHYVLDFHCHADKKEKLPTLACVKLLFDSKKYLKQKQNKEKWPGQTRYLASMNLLGHPKKLPIIYVKNSFKLTPLARRHTQAGLFKHGRVGHTKSAIARSNYKMIRRWDVPANIRLLHLNRQYHRKHATNFPVFDDNEYLRSRRSSGWKAHKYHHQYEAHLAKHIDTSTLKTIKSCF